MAEEKSKVVVILGPTASRKTRLAVQLAEEIKGEIISADSRQVHMGLDIGSGKDFAEKQRLAKSNMKERLFTVICRFANREKIFLRYMEKRCHILNEIACRDPFCRNVLSWLN